MRISTADLFPQFDYERRLHCHFGITEGIAAAVAGGLTAAGATGAAIGTAAAPGLLAEGIGGGLLGAAGGAGLSAIQGQDPLIGALTGGLTGGAISGLGPAIGSATGIGATAGEALAGAGAGAVGGLITGGSPLLGAATGGAAGVASGVLGGSSSTATGATAVPPAATTGVAGGTGAGSVAPTSIAAPAGGPSSDLTSAAGTAAAAPAATGGSAVSDLGDWSSRPSGLSNLFGGGDSGGLGGFLSKNPQLLLAAAPLALNMLSGSTPLPGETQLNRAAGEAGSMARALSAPQLSGVLPAGLQSVVDQSQNAAIAKIKTSYAQMGLGGSTSEGQAIAAAKQNSAVQVAKIADDLARQGLSWASLSSTDLSNLLTAQERRDTQFTTALTTFASGLAGAALKSS